MIGALVTIGGIAAFVVVITLLDWITVRHDRKTGRSQRARAHR